MRFRTPTSNGGTTSTGGLAWRFFSREVIPTLERILEKSRISNAGNIFLIHRNLSVIMRVIASTGKVDCDKFEIFCKDTYAEIMEEKA